jgi:hypothetical protein
LGKFQSDENSNADMSIDTAVWHTQRVDESWGVENSSLTMDNEGFPHIIYFDGDDYELRYAYLNSSGWQFQVVESNVLVDVGSIELDIYGYPHISYYDNTLYYELVHAYQDVYGWHFETVDNVGSGGYQSPPSLELNRLGYPCISYISFSDKEIKYACKDINGWHPEYVALSGFFPGSTSLALDDFDNPHISAVSYLGDLIYIHRTTIEWVVRDVDTEGYTAGYGSSIALDDQGYPHISYVVQLTDPRINEIRYAHLDAAGWQVETIETDSSGTTSIALDEFGYPHVSYLDSKQDWFLKYANKDGYGWNIQIVRSGFGFHTSNTSLALNNDDCPSISFQPPTYLNFSTLCPFYFTTHFLPVVHNDW